VAGATTSGIDAQMHHWGALSGRVTSASTHAPIEGVEVDAYDGSQHTAVTNANGEYTISHLGNRSGEYTVSFEPHSGEGLDFFPQWYDEKESQLASDPVHVSLDHTTSGIDAALSEGGKVTGRVTDAATKQPLAEITVCAWSKVVYESRCAWTNSNGEYAIVRLPAEEFQISFYTNADNYYSESYSGSVAVTLGHATAGIDAAMEPVVKGTIMGSVREADWAKAIPNIEVCAYDIEQEELFGECTKSNSAGWYELRGLSGGEYLVEFSSLGPGLEYATQFYDKKPSPLYAEPVTVTEGKFTSGIEGALEKAGDASGKVTSAETGKPLKGVDACYYDFAEFLVGCEPTNEKGEYKTPPIAYGEYRVLFASPPESGLNYAMQFYGGVASINDSPRITIEAGKLTTGIDAQMASGGSITGDVTDADSGKGLEGALVCALPGFGEVGVCTTTDASTGWTPSSTRFCLKPRAISGSTTKMCLSSQKLARSPSRKGRYPGVSMQLCSRPAVNRRAICSHRRSPAKPPSGKSSNARAALGREAPRRASPTVGRAGGRGTGRRKSAPATLTGCSKPTKDRACSAR
jgi:hypothetical protein